MTLVGSKEEFLKNFFAGNLIQLPIKGTHIIKRDHPLILASSNHSFRELFYIRYQSKCLCDSPNDLTFCSNQPGCNVPQTTKNLYKALLARIIPIEVTAPLFPDGDSNPDLYYEWKNFLLDSIIFQPDPFDLRLNYNNSTHPPLVCKNQTP